MQDFRDKNEWALILGGSSGIGLATAKKLGSLGLNLFIVHRDRRGAMEQIEKEFSAIRATGVQLINFNTNALSAEGRSSVLSGIADHIAKGRIKLLLHSIALGNLKLVAPLKNDEASPIKYLATTLGTDAASLQEKIDKLLPTTPELTPLATKAPYNSDLLVNEEDMAQTIYNMGTNLLSWVQEVFQRKLFCDDARVLGLTSEGNAIHWRGYAAVSAAKAALEAVARAIAVEYAPFGIRCNILQPGITDTPALRLIPGSDHMKANALLRNPFKRLTTPQDVAGVVAMMASPEAGWINGTIIRVDGGEHIGS